MTDPRSTPTRQLLIYRFDADPNFEGRLVGALERMESGGALRIVEALFVGYDAETGELAAIDLRSRGAGSLVSPLIGFRLDPRERKRAAITALLVEHTWARALADAMSQSGGAPVSSGFVEAETLSELTPLLVAAASGD
jgi:hypothetical protein